MRTVLLAATLCSIAVSAAAQTRPDPGPLTIAREGSFFVGGHDVKSDTLSSIPGYAPSGTVNRRSGLCALSGPGRHFGRADHPHSRLLPDRQDLGNNPDGRMGWDEYFVRHGHPTYVIDQAWRGRSAGDPSAINAVRDGKAPADQLPKVFSAGHEGAWAIFRFGKEYPETMPGMRFPLAAQEEFWKQMVPDSLANLPTPNPTVPALSELAQKIDGTVLMSHSQSGIFPFQTAALNRKGIAASLRSSRPAARRRPTT